jgi:hypothetical protein
MNTITEADRIEVVVHRVPEELPKTPQWLLELAGRSPVQSPLPIQYSFAEPKQHKPHKQQQASLVQWLLAFLKIH